MPRKLEDQSLIIRAALKGAIEMANRDDWQATHTLIAAARHQLGLVSERYSGTGLQSERALLLKASRELQAMENATSSPEEFSKAVADWLVRFDKTLGNRLAQKQARSLYNPDKLGFVAPQRETR